MSSEEGIKLDNVVDNTGDTIRKSSTSGKDAALRQSKICQASQLGESMRQSSKAKDVSDYVKVSKVLLDFSIAALLAQRALLEELSKMSDDEKMETLFALLDKSGDGSVDATELAEGLRKIRGDVNFEESLVVAVDRIATFDNSGNGKLNLTDFNAMATELCGMLGTNFHELSEMLVMSVLFGEGNSLEENVAGVLVSEDMTQVVKDEQAARKAMVDRRMKSLFKLFDLDGDGKVDFKEVAIGMYRITEDLDGSSKAALQALMMFDEDSTRSLDYVQFAKFIIHVVAASPDHITFDDVADALTFAAAQDVTMTAEELLAVLMLDETYNEVLDIQEEAAKHMAVSKSQLVRASNLFKLWDLDGDGNVDIKELALGLRKFEETSSMKNTVDEAIKLMDTFDLDGDRTLDLKEFVVFLVQFSNLAGADLDDMLDFMVVTSGLKNNTDAEVKYIKSLNESDLQCWSPN